MQYNTPYTRALFPWVFFTSAASILLFFGLHLPFLLSLLIGLNIGTFLLYGLDKQAAGIGRERVPEKILWLAAFLGGPFGAALGMQLFRHKTKKTSFQFVLALLVLIQIALAAWYYSSHGTPFLPNMP